MKTALLLTLLFWQAVPGNKPPVPQPDAMQYERAIRVPAGAGQACAMLDAPIFPHAAPSLTDLRLVALQDSSSGSASTSARLSEIPYAITMSEAVTEETEPARLLNLGIGNGRSSVSDKDATLVFDLEMPQRAYTDVTLDLDPEGQDFLATATVTGSDTLGDHVKSTALGSFTLFDLSSQHLSRDTTLPLEESTFHYLHVVLSFLPASGSVARFAPAMVQGAEVPPSREAQTIYTTVAETSSIANVGHESRAIFNIPRRVPVERVSFQIAPGFKGNFSRNVRVTALAAKNAGSDDARESLHEVVTGNILRVQIGELAHAIHMERLGVPAILGANLQRDAKVEVTIENGDDQPLPIASVRLEMRQRKLCFDVPAANSSLNLFYSDPKLLAPNYDYSRLFVASAKPLLAELGPEIPNPIFNAPPAEVRPFTERHSYLFWLALIAVICVLGAVALKSSRNVGA